jgi:poly(ADP-ribose) glycohydrolase
VALILPCDCGALPESIGGGSISYGCVQEEIMFACHPELNCARLIFTPMRGNEAFVLVGAEQFAEPRGYAFNLECGGPYTDQTPLQPDSGAEPAEPAAGGAAAAAETEGMPVDGDALDRFGGGQLAAYVTAIDAMDYRGARDLSVQFQPEYVKRELLKAFAGFALPPEVVGSRPPATLATGNWGAGAFMGDGRLKALIQWAAASEAGLSMCYFPFDDSYLAEELQPVA